MSELLILHYKSFLKTLMVFSKYENGIIIDIENYYREREDELELLFKEPLIVVDPIDRGRNVASAVRPQKLYTLVAAARAFLRKPNAKFFYPPKIIPMTIGRLKQELARRGPTVILLIFGRVKAVSDVLWGQLYKSQRSLRKQIQLSGFNVLRDTPWSDEETMNMFIFELEQRSISPVKKHIGPPLQKLRACERFLQKHVGNPNAVSGPYIEGGKWVVEILRRHTDVVGLLKEKLKDGGRRAGVAEHISRTLGNTLKIYVDKEIVDVYGENMQFAEFFTEFLSGRPKWLEDHNRTNNTPSVQQ